MFYAPKNSFARPQDPKAARYKAYDKPDRHSIAEIARTIPAHHEFTRISGVMATLERIAKLKHTGLSLGLSETDAAVLSAPPAIAVPT